MTTETYPLYSLDNGDPSDDRRYVGPFETADRAQAVLADLRADGAPATWTVRRCRRLRASELPFWKGFDLVEFIDDDVADDPPDGARIWADWEEQLLHGRDGATAALMAWADEYIRVDVYELEPAPEPADSRKLDAT